MRKTDYNFGDALAGDMEKIMESDEHKQMFNKIAIDLSPSSHGFDPDSPEAVRGLSDRMLAGPKGVGGTPMKDRPYTPGAMPGQNGLTMVDQPDNVSDQDADAALLESEQEKLDSLLESRNSNEETDLLKSSQQVPNAKLKTTFPVSKAEWDKLKDWQKESIRKKDGPPPWEDKFASDSLLETLVKVADFLGKEGFDVSEAAADRLITTLILEAAKKDKKDKKEKAVKECKECKKPCDKCKCEDGKKGKECKEDKKAKEDKKK
jgi:hypothetical protein